MKNFRQPSVNNCWTSEASLKFQFCCPWFNAFPEAHGRFSHPITGTESPVDFRRWFGATRDRTRNIHWATSAVHRRHKINGKNKTRNKEFLVFRLQV